MEQTENGEFRTKESAFKQFRHTCLGKIVIALVVFAILLIIAWLTNPSDMKMRTEMEDNIKQSIWSRDSIETDGLDIFIGNIGHTFTHWSDSVTTDMKDRMHRFNENNTVAFYDNTFFSTMRLSYRLKDVNDKLVGIGIFGMVIPLVDFNQFIPSETPMPNYDNPSLVGGGESEEYFGTTTVDVFRWEGE